jgi:hypothetical protein
MVNQWSDGGGRRRLGVALSLVVPGEGLKRNGRRGRGKVRRALGLIPWDGSNLHQARGDHDRNLRRGPREAVGDETDGEGVGNG